VFNEREGGHGLEVHEHELIEVSLCNRGANPDTATLAKSMLRDRADLLALVDDQGSREVAELKDEIAALNERLRASEGVVSRLGDKLADLDDIVAWNDKQRNYREQALRQLAAKLERLSK
jgi:predicted nuclease with TOPRIM domain